MAAFLIRLLEEERSGIYDVNGLPKSTTMAMLARTAIETLGVRADIAWIDERFLERQGLTGWVDLPLWIGPSHRMPGFMNTSVERALKDGLSMRPLSATIRNTRAWLTTRVAYDNESGSVAGITRERERNILAAWNARPR